MDAAVDLLVEDSDSDLDEDLMVCSAISVSYALLWYGSRFIKTPQHTSVLSGQLWLDELLGGHDGRFYNELGMQKFVFRRLLTMLETNAGLQGTRHVSAAEQAAIFLHYVRRGLSNRALQERFQRSGDTIMRCIYRILRILTSEQVYRAFVRLPAHDAPVPTTIQKSSMLSQYFRGCLGALDGTHIPAHVPEARRNAYRNRKSQLSQNVLAACDFDLKFIYVLPGWEGSAADSRVLEDAKSNDFIIPEGRYYLGDAGYPNSASLLVPYRNTRYHLKEWGHSRGRHNPQNHRELFNFRHAQLRNHIERIFGLFKRRYRVLLLAPEYPLTVQAQLVPALAVLHNFIRIHDPSDLPSEDDDPYLEAYDYGDDGDEPQNPTEHRDAGTRFRDEMAQNMWREYKDNNYRNA